MSSRVLGVVAVLCLTGGMSLCASAELDLYREIRVEQDIGYLGPDREEKADLYAPVPKHPYERFPGVVIIHGGGWVGGDKGRDREINIGTNLAKAGYVCLSINYQLGDGAWPGNLHDCKKAVQYLRQQADALQVDAGFIGAIGGSAGGHLASMLGVTGPDAGLEPEGPLSGFSSRVQAVVDMYGVANIGARREMDDLGNPTGPAKGGNAAKVIGEDPQLWDFASPVHHLGKDDPPFLVLHGTADTTVDRDQSIEFAAKLKAAGVPCELRLIEGIGHTFDLQSWRKKPLPDDLRPVVIGFFDRHLKHSASVVPLWPEGVPGGEGAPDNETWVNRSKINLNRNVKNVHVPAMTVYLPQEETATGAAVVICPGGGYGGLAIDKEGHDIARWLNGFGVAGFVLKYRLPRPEGIVYGHTGPLSDAQRAIRIVRSRAEEWNVDPGRVGIMGFSAGGHLASTAGTHFDPGIADSADSLRGITCRPDFQILIYPVISMNPKRYHSGSSRNLIGENPSEELVRLFSNELQVAEDTPPAFLITTGDDRVKAENSIHHYLALHEAGVPAEMHVYPTGGHGYGLLDIEDRVSTWPERCRDWMADLGVLERP